MGEGEEWSIRELGDLILRIGSVLLLLVVISGVIYISTRKTTKEPSLVDFENIISELQDLRNGETIKVPVLSTGYTFILRPMSQVSQLGLNCDTKKGNFCACLKEKEAIITCKSLHIQVEGNTADSGELTTANDEIDINSNKGITLTYGEGTITIS